MKDIFSTYHPIINFMYFSFVIGCSMFFIHPVCLLISFFSALAYTIYLEGKKALFFQLKFILPAFVVMAAVNPLFNHRGVTILTYFPNGNPLTLESITYGIAASAMLLTVVIWFKCYHVIMTSDKFIYLFGKIIPSLSLIISMTLRFVPLFQLRLKEVVQAQRCLGNEVNRGKLVDRVKLCIKIFSIMLTWMLENAIETANAMKSRGYGLKGRTAFSIFRFDRRDQLIFILLLLADIYILFGASRGGLRYRYYPSMKGAEMSPYIFSVMLLYLAVCCIPLMLNWWEDRKWAYLKSKI